MQNITTDLIYLVAFSIFIVLQSLAINGVHEAFNGKCWDDIVKGRMCSGNIFFKIAPEFLNSNRNKDWAMPFYGCVRCMGSVVGGVIYWSVILPLFGFHWIEVIVWVWDVFILAVLNFYIHKKL